MSSIRTVYEVDISTIIVGDINEDVSGYQVGCKTEGFEPYVDAPAKD